MVSRLNTKTKFLMMMLSIFTFGVEAQSNLFLMDNFNNNPALISQNKLHISASYSKRFMNIEGAPTTSVLTASTYFKNKKVGLGVILGNDKVAIYEDNFCLVAASYSFYLNGTSYISFGMSTGLNNTSNNYLDLELNNDPLFSNNERMNEALVGVGIAYRNPFLSIGISAPQVYRLRTIGSMMDQKFVLNVKFNFEIHPDYFFEPLVRMEHNVLDNTVVYGGAKIRFLDNYLSLGFDSAKRSVIGIGFNIIDSFQIQYNYLLSLNTFHSLNDHMVTINYKIRE